MPSSGEGHELFVPYPPRFIEVTDKQQQWFHASRLRPLPVLTTCLGVGPFISQGDPRCCLPGDPDRTRADAKREGDEGEKRPKNGWNSWGWSLN